MRMREKPFESNAQHAAPKAVMQRAVGEGGARAGCCLRLLRSAPSRQQPARRGASVTVAVGWDPENVLAGPQEGHIARRQ